jgi:large repetitive protein
VVFGDGFEGGDLTAWSAVVSTPAAPSDPPDPPAPTDAADAPPECVASGGVVTCDLADLEPGASVTFSLDGVISGSASGSLTTTASISGTGTESDPTNDEATLTFSVARRLIDLSIALTATPDPVPAGTTLQYDATVTNSGQAEATNAVIDLYLPLDTTLQTSLVSPSGTCSGDQPLTCTLGTLAASGGSASVTLQVLVAADAEPFLTLNALATADQVDADTGNDEASVDVEVN